MLQGRTRTHTPPLLLFLLTILAPLNISPTFLRPVVATLERVFPVLLLRLRAHDGGLGPGAVLHPPVPVGQPGPLRGPAALPALGRGNVSLTPEPNDAPMFTLAVLSTSRF